MGGVTASVGADGGEEAEAAAADTGICECVATDAADVGACTEMGELAATLRGSTPSDSVAVNTLSAPGRAADANALLSAACAGGAVIISLIFEPSEGADSKISLACPFAAGVCAGEADFVSKKELDDGTAEGASNACAEIGDDPEEEDRTVITAGVDVCETAVGASEKGADVAIKGVDAAIEGVIVVIEGADVEGVAGGGKEIVDVRGAGAGEVIADAVGIEGAGVGTKMLADSTGFGMLAARLRAATSCSPATS